MPDGVLNAKRGDYLGWYDQAPNGEAAIPYSPDQGRRVCSQGQKPQPALDEALDVHDPDVSVLKMERRKYALHVCYGELYY